MPVSWCLICPNAGEKGFFKLPQNNEEHRKSWVEATKLAESYKTITKSQYRICWKHFPTEKIKCEGQRVTLVTGMLLFFPKFIMVTKKHTTAKQILKKIIMIYFVNICKGSKM